MKLKVILFHAHECFAMCMPGARGGEQGSIRSSGAAVESYASRAFRSSGRTAGAFNCWGITSGSHKNSGFKKAIRTEANLEGQAFSRTEKEKAAVHRVSGYRVHNLRFKGWEDSIAPVA